MPPPTIPGERPPQSGVITNPGQTGVGNVNAAGDAALQAREAANAAADAARREADLQRAIAAVRDEIDDWIRRNTPVNPNVPRPSYPPLPPQYTGPNVPFSDQINSRMRLFNETRAQATAAIQDAQRGARVFTQAETAQIQRQLASETAAGNSAAGVSAVTRVIRTAGVSLVVITTGQQLIESLMTLESMNQIEAAANALLARCRQIQTMTVDNAGICELLKAELAAMWPAIQALERRYSQLLPNRQGVIGRAGQEALDRIFNPLVEARAAAERRLTQDCFQFQNRARADAIADLCVEFYILAIERTLASIARARAMIWEQTAVGRTIEGLTGEYVNMVNDSLRQMQRWLFSGAITTAIARQDVATMVANLDNPGNPMVRAIEAIRAMPTSDMQLSLQLTMIQYKRGFDAAIRALQTGLAICPPPQLPPQQPPPAVVPGS